MDKNQDQAKTFATRNELQYLENSKFISKFADNYKSQLTNQQKQTLHEENL